MKILVIDDEKPTLSMFNLFLSAYGYDVHVAEDGQKGLALFSQIKPDIVFTDIKMPGIDGLEVLRRIKKTGIKTEVIIITGHGDMEKAVEALDLNASDFINKPVERKALDAALSRAQKRRELPEQIPFECKTAPTDKGLSITIKGRLMQSSKNILIPAFDQPDARGVKAIRLLFDNDFSIDRSGLSILTELLQQAKQKKIAVTMENLSYNFIQVFKMVGIHKMARLVEPLPET